MADKENSARFDDAAVAGVSQSSCRSNGKLICDVNWIGLDD